ncbi:Glyceraldehyde-3-phosphate dehydrogenase [Cricetulus griseus]|uniref:glyceraldehyde-3-phosphate dehydrogenase (phosphorylating) n=1 Tax=Cricetulus griseus TaxID=10029 RepID=G3HMF3_CRIGR|nr:Glyceraldehyde-3-phosphate dehydrogenase [Cricetulus griseus]ERE81777.1 glyceraldehyde-3-phosphate dehydrogenase [Cricetulus griseus]
MAYMFQYDSIHGKFHSTVKAEKGKLVSNDGKAITFQDQDLHIKCGDGGAKYFVDFTGVFNTTEKAVAHLKGRDQRVSLSASSAKVPMFVMGVKHLKCDNSLQTISKVSPASSNHLGKVIQDNFPLSLLPSPPPATPTGPAKAVDKVILELNRKITVDLTCSLEKAAKYNCIKKLVKQASEGPVKSILGYTED